MDFFIERLNIGERIFHDMPELTAIIRQITPHMPSINMDYLALVLSQPQTKTVLVAREKDTLAIIGIGSIFFTRTLSGGLQGNIGEIAVCKSGCGQAVEREIISALIEDGKNMRVSRINFIQPRDILIGILSSAGFSQQEGKMYRLVL